MSLAGTIFECFTPILQFSERDLKAMFSIDEINNNKTIPRFNKLIHAEMAMKKTKRKISETLEYMKLKVKNVIILWLNTKVHKAH